MLKKILEGRTPKGNYYGVEHTAHAGRQGVGSELNVGWIHIKKTENFCPLNSDGLLDARAGFGEDLVQLIGVPV